MLPKLLTRDRYQTYRFLMPTPPNPPRPQAPQFSRVRPLFCALMATRLSLIVNQRSGRAREARLFCVWNKTRTSYSRLRGMWPLNQAALGVAQ